MGIKSDGCFGARRRVKLICGLLFKDDAIVLVVKETLEKVYGPIDAQSPVIPFEFTDYYNKEMGEGIRRQYISFQKPVPLSDTGRIKRRTIKIEKKFSRGGGKRQVNIDPGYVVLDKMVLSTTKDATYRIYLGKGIYAQSTLFFQDNTFHPWSWTYADYKTDMAIEFFNEVRMKYKQDISGAKNC